MLPCAALDRRFQCVGRRSIRHHHKPLEEVFVDVSSHECIHLVAARGDSSDILLR
jgi:hypothetical protein